jgi:hypothetical protein
MEAQINFSPKTKQLRKFKLFESKDVSNLIICNFLAIYIGWLRQGPERTACLIYKEKTRKRFQIAQSKRYN